MKISPAGLIAAGILVCTGVTQAVTITTNNVVRSTTVNGTTTTGNQTFDNSGTISTTGTATTQTIPTVGTWQFNGLSLASLAVSRAGGAGNNPVTAAASAVHTIAFTLGVGESATVTLNLGYSLVESGQNATLGWSFTGPGGTNISAISGSVGAAATNQNLTNQTVPQQQVNITTAGTYTFVLTGAIPSQAITKNSSGSISLNSFGLNIVAVPEPTSAVLGSLGVGLLMFRRRRIPS
ncbi:MAG: PEP-CTERM sorting domain-containing protein [Verrucomicrobiaceae bacterium]|nr:MAG: PEP-CTERM sorting domain-containing protein [Verrucomicrobiaceae bacterium]